MSNDKFYELLSSDPNEEYASEVQHIVDDLKNQAVISEADHKFLTQDLEHVETPIFYGLPKIHKMFDLFPPLRPIVSQMKSATRRLSEFLDSFLKYKARRTSSFIRDTKHVL